MSHLKSVLLVLVVAICATCYGQELDRYPGGYKKKHHHHHHGMHYLHFLTYLSFLAVKLKIVFFLGTIFTISLVAAKVIGIIKLTEYMKHKYPEHHHEEKIVYVNPHEHDHGGYSGGPSDFYSSKSYSAYPPDFSLDQPPEGAYDHNERFAGPPPYENVENSARGSENGVFRHLRALAHQLTQLNITDIALNEMGIKEESCKRKFVCQADFNAQQSAILRTGFNILRDVSYQRYRPNVSVTSEEECASLYPECGNNPG